LFVRESGFFEDPCYYNYCSEGFGPFVSRPPARCHYYNTDFLLSDQVYFPGPNLYLLYLEPDFFYT